MPTLAPDAAAAIRPARGGRAPLVLAAFLGFCAGDLIKPPPDQAFARLAVGTIDTYRVTLSPLIAKTGLARCRFTPSCSAFGRAAIVRYGFPRGAWLAAGRVLRCHPFAKGGYDPVP